jgi:hypothetical protein
MVMEINIIILTDKERNMVTHMLKEKIIHIHMEMLKINKKRKMKKKKKNTVFIIKIHFLKI